jgi:hypothetical protein
MRCSIWLLEDQFGSSMLDVAMGDATGVEAGERNDGKNDVSVYTSRALLDLDVMEYIVRPPPVAFPSFFLLPKHLLNITFRLVEKSCHAILLHY